MRTSDKYTVYEAFAWLKESCAGCFSLAGVALRVFALSEVQAKLLAEGLSNLAIALSKDGEVVCPSKEEAEYTAPLAFHIAVACSW
eukprot:s2368_g12.t1